MDSISVELRSKVYRLKTQEKNPPRTTTEGNGPHITRCGVPVCGYNRIGEIPTALSSVRKMASRDAGLLSALITELAESGAGDETVMDIAGHVAKQMLKHYSHIRMEAKRKALETVAQKRVQVVKEEKGSQHHAELTSVAQHFEGQSLQKSLQSGVFEGHPGCL